VKLAKIQKQQEHFSHPEFPPDSVQSGAFTTMSGSGVFLKPYSNLDICFNLHII
jgi:hypothetical protein